ncbi:NUMOD4 motif-containing HNH endonuclease [Bacillus sp. CGMCC 1.60114]|uniref:NUMOD4 motif-containing HNH endonuclease n=1 Tax=unclassified Bacillus (in: firmicutes) TaxID=185979 RepID=UPI00363BFD17
MDREIWKPIKNFEEKYEVSNFGNTRTIAGVFDRKRDEKIIKVRKRSKVLKLIDHINGYKYVNLSDAKHHYVHRLVAEAFIPKEEGKNFVNHIDGNKSNNCIDNLEWCTHKENLRHARDKQLLRVKGESNPSAKLRKEDIEYIRKHYIPYDRKFGGGALARKFGVSVSTINLVVLRKNWNY